MLKSAGVKSRILVTGPVFEAPATGYVRLNDTTFLQPYVTQNTHVSTTKHMS